MKVQCSSCYEFTVLHVPDVYLDVLSFCSLPFLYLLSLLLGYIFSSSVVEDCECLVGSLCASCSELELVLYSMIAMIARCILLFMLLRLVGCLDRLFLLWRIITAGFLNYSCVYLRTRKGLLVVEFKLPQSNWTAILLSQCIGNRGLIHPT